MRNLSDRLEAEEALKKSELHRKFILETIPDLLFIVNKNGIFTSYHGNRNALYQPPEFFLNKKLDSVLPENLAKKTMNYVKKSIQSKKIKIFEYDLLINKKICWFEARMIAINKDEVMIIVRDITSLRENQEKLVKNEEYLQTIINSASEIIFTLDKRNRIIIWNDTAKKLTGYKNKDVINHNLDNINIIVNLKEFKSYLDNIIIKRKTKPFEITINTKYKTKRIWSVSPSIIFNKPDEVKEILFICNDVTYDKESYSKIIFGRSYLFFDRNNDKIFNIFCRILNKRYNGLIITREITDKINETCEKRKIDLIKMSSINKSIKSINNPDSLYELIEKRIRNDLIIFIDRLDFFINLYSYHDVIINLYKINDLVQKKKALLIIRLNPDSLSNKEIALLKEEFFEYGSESFDEVIIDKDLYEILKFINSRNEKNIIVTYKEIGLKFSISKITVSKKIQELISLNLVNSIKSGRTKILQLTDKGKTIIKNNLSQL
jgi:PAS domain S-box-containing protein